MAAIRREERHISSLKAKMRMSQLQDECASDATDFAHGDGANIEIMSVGDCHGGRTTRLLSSDVRVHFYGGCIFTWIHGGRHVPALMSLLPRRVPSAPSPRTIVVIFSYGEIDCRCHFAKWQDDDDGLASPYVAKVRTYVDECTSALGRYLVLPIVLAVPPATEQGDRSTVAPSGPAASGSLWSRSQATHRLNLSLERACAAQGVCFSGTDTWRFAEDESGSLRRELCESGHVQIKSCHCGPVHERLRHAIREHTKHGSPHLFPRRREAQERCVRSCVSLAIGNVVARAAAADRAAAAARAEAIARAKAEAVARAKAAAAAARAEAAAAAAPPPVPVHVPPPPVVCPAPPMRRPATAAPRVRVVQKVVEKRCEDERTVQLRGVYGAPTAAAQAAKQRPPSGRAAARPRQESAEEEREEWLSAVATWQSQQAPTMAKSQIARAKAAERVRHAQRARLETMVANAEQGAREEAQRISRRANQRESQREMLSKALAAAILPPKVPQLPLPAEWQPTVQPPPSLASLRPRPASGRPRKAVPLVSSSADSALGVSLELNRLHLLTETKEVFNTGCRYLNARDPSRCP